MQIIGCHLSVAKGFLAMGEEAGRLGANTFQFFTRNPRGSKAKAWDQEDIDAYQALAEAKGFGVILAHAPYTLNLCSKEEKTRQFARQTMADDLQRLEMLPGNYYNFHPGSHVGQGVQTGIHLIAQGLREVLPAGPHTTVLLETMAGKGTEVGRNFEEIAAILDLVGEDRVGVCLDTCHVWDGGYDIRDHLEEVLALFDRIIGLNRLKAIHLNDSKNLCHSQKDRHEKIGQGQIGAAGLLGVLCHPSLCQLPFYLETPNDLDGYAQEIRFLRQHGPECLAERGND